MWMLYRGGGLSLSKQDDARKSPSSFLFEFIFCMPCHVAVRLKSGRYADACWLLSGWSDHSDSVDWLFFFFVLFFSDDLDNILNTHTEASCMAANRKRAGGQTKEILRPGENMKRTTTEAGAATTKKGQNCGRLRVREKRRNRSISRNDEAEKCV